MTLLYTSIGITVFTLTLGTLVALNPKFDTERSVVISTDQQAYNQAKEEEVATASQDDSSTPSPTPTPAVSNQTTKQRTAPVLAAQSSPRAVTPSVEPVSPPEQPAPTAAEEPIPQEPTESPAPAETTPTDTSNEQDPSLLGGLLQGVGNLLNAII